MEKQTSKQTPVKNALAHKSVDKEDTAQAHEQRAICSGTENKHTTKDKSQLALD
jgi:hypothetical protein